MSFRLSEEVAIALLALAVWAPQAPAQAPTGAPARTHPVPATNITVDGNEAMFATMCALYASGSAPTTGPTSARKCASACADSKDPR